jgi:tRNA (guanine-N7-)-methyltransferase
MPSEKKIKASKHRILLWNGLELQFHRPLDKSTPLSLADMIPNSMREWPLEVEIGPGKGEYLAARAREFPDRFFIGIDRRWDRVRLTEKKLQKNDLSDGGQNWIILREDARSFLEAGIPALNGLHLYQPDPWPKERHHKHRFFRSPDARQWAESLKPGSFFSFSTDHMGYFEEMLDIVKTWGFLELGWAWQKSHLSGKPKTYFEGIFLKQRKPVYKAVFIRKFQPSR